MAFRVLKTIFCTTLAICCLTVSGSVCLAQQADSDPSPTIYSETPFAVLVNRITQQDAVDYLRNMSDQLKIGGKALEFYDKSEVGKMVSEVERPVSGTLFFLAKGMLPSVANVSFSEVKDEADYMKLLRQVAGRTFARKNGEEDNISGKDGKHKVTNSWSNKVPLATEFDPPTRIENDLDLPDDGANIPIDAEGADVPDTEPAATRSVSISVGSGSGVGVQVQSLDDDNTTIIEEDGVKYSQTTYNFDQYYRYHGNLMYQGQDASIWDMNLPTKDGVMKDASRDVDLGAEVYLERIPFGLKSLGWNMLYGGMSTQMQQRDEESDIDYNFRSSGGELALAIAKAGMFDANHVKGFIQLADDQNPIRAELNISANQGSGLSKRLEDFSSARSRFAPIINDGAAVTLHSSIKLPEESIRVIKSGAEWMKDQLIKEAGTDVEMVLGGVELAETMVSIADQTNLEFFAKLGWTEASGGVIYAGMQVDDNPELLRSVLTLLTPETTPREIAERFIITRSGDLDVIEFRIPSLDASAEFPIQLTHLYIAHANSCLWFCVGGETSVEILKSSIARCESSGIRANTRVVSAEVDFDAWMAYPQDDATGLTRIPTLADMLLAKTLKQEMFGGGEVFEEDLIYDSGDLITYNPVPIATGDDQMQRVIDLGGRTDIRLYLDSTSGGLTLHADVGKAIGTYVAARYMQAIESFVDNIEIPDPAEAMEAEPVEAIK